MTDIPVAPTPPEPRDKFTIPQPAFQKNRSYRREDYPTLFDGIAEIPNFEPMEVWKVARIVTSFYGWLVEGKMVKLPGSGTHKSWSRGLYMLTGSQGGNWTGEGYVITTKGYAADESSVVAGKFAICKHEKIEDPGANHDRGWHPGHCGKCGLNMNVDSGD